MTSSPSAHSLTTKSLLPSASNMTRTRALRPDGLARHGRLDLPALLGDVDEYHVTELQPLDDDLHCHQAIVRAASPQEQRANTTPSSRTRIWIVVVWPVPTKLALVV